MRTLKLYEAYDKKLEKLEIYFKEKVI